MTDSPYSATYTNPPNSTLINTLAFTNTGAGSMLTTRRANRSVLAKQEWSDG